MATRTCSSVLRVHGCSPAEPAYLFLLQGQQQQAGAGGYQDLFVPDFMFRLNMLQHRYPNYIEPTMVDQWSADVQEVHRICFVQQRTCYRTLSQHAVQWGSDAVGILCFGSDVHVLGCGQGCLGFCKSWSRTMARLPQAPQHRVWDACHNGC